MGRWEPDARGRLAKAAFELFDENGFDNTTVADIAAAAGVTERTFFRHFADKPDVLFSGSEAMTQEIVDAMLAAPAELTPVELAETGVAAAGNLFGDTPEFSRRRSRVVSSSFELRERELAKLANMGRTIAATLCSRGTDETTATLTGEVAVAVFRVAFERWVAAGEGITFAALAHQEFSGLRRLVAEPDAVSS